MDQTKYLISMLQQQRNQALDAVAELAAQLNAAREQIAAALAEMEQLRAVEQLDSHPPTTA
jgi:ABC-type transporter Mla subunit MlaD